MRFFIEEIFAKNPPSKAIEVSQNYTLSNTFSTFYH
jgi:hypothetical protein